MTRDSLRMLLSQVNALRLSMPELEPLQVAVVQLDSFHVRFSHRLTRYRELSSSIRQKYIADHDL